MNTIKEIRDLADRVLADGNQLLSRQLHSLAHDEHHRKKWESQDHQCSGSGYAHKPHGACTGYTYDRT